MNAKRANWLFLIIIILTMMMILMINVLYLIDGTQLSVIMNNLLSEMCGLMPAIAFVLVSGDKFSEIIPIKPVRVPVLLLIPVVLILVFPVIILINAFSMLFVDNTVLSASGQIISEPMWKMLLSIGIFAPFAEEVVCRGAFYHSYRRSGRTLGAVILSAVIFGFIHLNLNQAGYAFFIGFVFAMMAEATGSILPTIIAHAVFNSFEVCLMYAQDSMFSGSLQEAQNILDGSSGKLMLIRTMSSLFVPAIGCGAVAFLVIYLMSILQNRPDAIKNMFTRGKQQGQPLTENGLPAGNDTAGYPYREKLVTAPLIAGFVIGGIYIAYTTVIMILY